MLNLLLMKLANKLLVLKMLERVIMYHGYKILGDTGICIIFISL